MPRNARSKTPLRPVPLKLPQELYSVIKQGAERQKRSVNAHITFLLERLLQKELRQERES